MIWTKVRNVSGAIVLGVFIITWGCAHQQKPYVPVSVMDSAEHHCSTGNNLLERGMFNEALGEYQQAELIKPRYAPVQIGIGLSLVGMKRFDDAFAAFRKARNLVTSDPERILYHTGMMRLYTGWQGYDWLNKVEKHFKEAQAIHEEDPAPYYYMAAAYRSAREYGKASNYYEKVISLNRGYVTQSNNEWAEIQKTVRAIPGTRSGRDIAGSPGITRAEVAALFMEELTLERLYKGGVEPDTSVHSQEITDFQTHVLRKDIEAVITLGLRGLEPVGNRFYPDREITRAEFAVMLEDILVKITSEDGVPTSHIGNPSPFKDVDRSNYAYNAILTCTTRGILDSGIDGYFNPDKSVSGSDALLALRRLKGILASQNGNTW